MITLARPSPSLFANYFGSAVSAKCTVLGSLAFHCLVEFKNNLFHELERII